MAPNNQ